MSKLRTRAATALAALCAVCGTYVGYAHISAVFWHKYAPDSWSYRFADALPAGSLTHKEAGIRVEQGAGSMLFHGTGTAELRGNTQRLERGVFQSNFSLPASSDGSVSLQVVHEPNRERQLRFSVRRQGVSLRWQISGDASSMGAAVAGDGELLSGSLDRLSLEEQSTLNLSVRYNPLIHTFEMNVGDTVVAAIPCGWLAGTTISLAWTAEVTRAEAPIALTQLSWASETDRPLRGFDTNESFNAALFPPLGWDASPTHVDGFVLQRDKVGGALFQAGRPPGTASLCMNPMVMVPVTLDATWRHVDGTSGSFFLQFKNITGTREIVARFTRGADGQGFIRLSGHQGDDLQLTQLKEVPWQPAELSRVGLRYNPWLRRAQVTVGHQLVAEGNFALRKDEQVNTCVGAEAIAADSALKERLENVWLHRGPY